MRNYRFSIFNRDDEGNSLDESVLKAAEEIGPVLTRYREQELDCESSHALLQSAAEATSNANRLARIDNPRGYLTSVYKRLVDKILKRQAQFVPVDDDFLETLANSGQVDSFEDLIHNRLVLEQILNSMDAETRQICSWRLEGYSVEEIAEELHITPNCLSVRYRRGIKKAVRKVMPRNHGP